MIKKYWLFRFIITEIKTIIHFLKNRDVLHKNHELHNIYKGRKLIIVATGPSVLIDDLELINHSDVITFGVNSIFKIFPYTNFRPNFYCITDPTVFEKLQDDLSNIVFENSILNVFFKMRIDSLNSYFVLINNSRKTIRNTMLSKLGIFKHNSFSSKMYKFIRAGDTVVINMIQCAIWMGFDKIGIYGVDLDYNSNNSVLDYDRNLTTIEHDNNIIRQKKSFILIGRFANKSNVKIYDVGRKKALPMFIPLTLQEFVDKV